MNVILTPSGLQCPKCNNEYLQQEKVDVIIRDGTEDCIATRTVCERNKLPVMCKVNDDQIKETRRDVIKITFTCEMCNNAKRVLVIRQDKGTTYFEWKPLKK